MTAPAYLKGQDGTLELLLYGDIGSGPLSAASIAKVLDANKDAKLIRCRISSQGGDGFEGITIHNLLAKHPARVEVDIDGQASSAASLIAMAADHVRIASNSLMMVHEAHGGAGGTAAQHQSDAAMLSKVNSSAAAMYAAKTGKSAEEVTALMANDNWLTADEAVALKLADEGTDPKAIAASGARFLRSGSPPSPEKSKAADVSQRTLMTAEEKTSMQDTEETEMASDPTT